MSQPSPRSAAQYLRHQTSDKGGPFRCWCASCESFRRRWPTFARAIDQRVAEGAQP